MTAHHDPMDDQFAEREVGQETIDSYVASRTGHDDHGDTTVVLGRTLPFPLYTVVFFVLGLLTIIEVVLGNLEGGLRIPLLLGLALVKAYLVVYYYMHLKTDSRLFALVLLVPIVVAVISMIFLLMSPQGNY